MERNRNALTYAALAAVLLLSALLGVRYGSAELSASSFFEALFHREGMETHTVILYSVRLPRVLAGVLAGVGLSASGVLLQSVTDNGLAGPNVIGVNAGAGFAVITVLALAPTLSALLPLAAFLGAFLAAALILAVAGSLGSSKSPLILAGIALTALLNAGISAISLLYDDVLSSYNAFSVGGLAGISVKQLRIPALVIGVCFLTALIFSRRIGMLCLGDLSAASLGVNVKALRVICMALASALAGAVVSFAGLIGFVGLIVPHMARKLVGERVLSQLIASALIGGTLLNLGDLAGRVLAAPSEIPVGIMMSLLGAPFFLFLLWKKRNGA